MHLAGSKRVRSCYSYGGDRNWNKLADMTTARSSSAAVPIPGGIWVTGGWDGSKRLKTTENIFLNKTRSVGAPLPAARSKHCMVKYGDKIFSTGGWNEYQDATSNVWQFYSGDNFAKANGAVMKNRRIGHSCGIVHSIHHGSRPLLVVAGSSTGRGANGERNSELWDFTVPGSTWQLCSKSCSFSFIMHHYFKNDIQLFEYEILYILHIKNSKHNNIRGGLSIGKG